MLPTGMNNAGRRDGGGKPVDRRAVRKCARRMEEMSQPKP
jgi:hypothetical protein